MLPFESNAQHDAYWHFGDSIVLKWDTIGPVLEPHSPLVAFEACSGISDSSGSLLFYTNGNRFWNRNGIPMNLGDSLIPIVGMDPIATITQGVLALPFPGHANKYVVVLVGGIPDMRSIYSIVDMDLNGGLGDLVFGKHRVLLDSLGLSEKCAAVRHGNGRDWWIVQYRNKQVDTGLSDSTFNVYLLSKNGIEFSHSISSGMEGLLFRTGEMAFSEDGSLLGMAGLHGVQVFDFDRCKGDLSGPIFRLSVDNGYGLCFSPNGRFLYFTTGVSKELYQYDLNPDVNTDTLTLLASGTGLLEFGQLQLGMDNKIYMSINNLTGDEDLSKHLHVITNPNAYGIASDFRAFERYMEGRNISVGLPNMPNYDLGRLEGSPCDTVYAIDTTSNISSPQALDALTVVPTVSSDWFTVHGRAATNTDVLLSVYDALGRNVLQQEGPLPLRLDLSAEPAGAYFIRAFDGQRSQVLRIHKK
jgi:hypothetical protein